MKIHTLVLIVCTLVFAACASAPKKECCSSGGSANACPANDPHCKAPHAKPHGKHKAS